MLIFGGADNDFLVGGTGDDTIYGGEGNNALWGGAEAIPYTSWVFDLSNTAAFISPLLAGFVPVGTPSCA